MENKILPVVIGSIAGLLESKTYNNGAVTFRLSGDTAARVCVDQDDVERIMMFSPSWYLSSNGYVMYTANGQATQYLHKLVLGTISVGFVVDHVNGNKLDNRKINLQAITARQNIAKAKNVSPYGVNITKTDTSFRVRVIFEGKSVNIGRYYTLSDAKIARNIWYLNNKIELPKD